MASDKNYYFKINIRLLQINNILNFKNNTEYFCEPKVKITTPTYLAQNETTFTFILLYLNFYKHYRLTSVCFSFFEREHCCHYIGKIMII